MTDPIQQRATGARIGMLRAGDPEQEAEAYNLAPALGVTPAATALALKQDAARTRRAAIDVESLARKSPIVTEQLAGTRGPLISDDLDALSKIEPAAAPIAETSVPGFFDGLGASAEGGLYDLGENFAHLSVAYGLVTPEEGAAVVAEMARASAAASDRLPANVQAAQARLSPLLEDMSAAWAEWWRRTQRGVDAPAPVTEPVEVPETPPELEGLNLRESFVPGPRITPVTSDPTFIDRIVGGDFASPEALTAITQALGSTGQATSTILGDRDGRQFLMNESVRSAVANAPGLGAGTIGGFVGGPVGAGAGFFGGGVFTEVGAGIRERIDRRGVDRTDVDALVAAYQDVEWLAEMRSQAERKGVTTAAFGALFDTFAGGRIAKSLAGGGSLATRAARATGAGSVELVEQGVGEALSEGAGQLAADGEIRADDVLLEALLSSPSSAITISAGLARRSALAIREVSAARVSVAGVEKIAEAVQESKAATRTPEVVREIIDEVMVKTISPNTPVPLEAFEAHARATGRSPADLAQDITGSMFAYQDAQQTGTLTLSMGQLVAMDDADRQALAPEADLGGPSLVEAEAEAEALRAELEEVVGLDSRQEVDELTAELEEIEAEIAQLDDEQQGGEVFQGDREGEEQDAANEPRDAEAEADPLYDAAARFMIEARSESVSPGETQRVLASMVQRKFAVGYTRASRLIARMNDEGVFGERSEGLTEDPGVANDATPNILDLAEAAGLDPETTEAALNAGQEAGNAVRGEQLRARAEEIRARLVEVEAAVPVSDSEVVTAERDRIAGELRAAGLSRDEATVTAALPAAFFETMAERSGLPVADLIESARLSIGRRRGEVPTVEPAIVNQSGPGPGDVEYELDTDQTRLSAEGRELVTVEDIGRHNGHVRILETLEEGGYLPAHVLDPLVRRDSAPTTSEIVDINEALDRVADGFVELYEDIVEDATSDEPTAEDVEEWEGPDDLDEWAMLAKGVTSDPGSAGYILFDGTMLDFSGGQVGGRVEDHRDLGGLPIKGGGGGTEGMIAFMNATGAVRVDFASGLFEAQSMPTRAQMLMAVDAAESMGLGTLFLESSSEQGSPVAASELHTIEAGKIAEFFRDPESAPRDLFQSNTRGSLSIPPIGTASRAFDMTLWKSSDLSTPLHEFGHFFLEVLSDVTAQGDALGADFDAALEAIGVPGESPDSRRVSWNSRLGDDGQVTDEARAWHESFAEQFESYLQDGKAPSNRLRTAFALFRSWLLRVYRAITGAGVEVAPELRVVFDRLLATDQEIAQAQEDASQRALFGSPQEAGMTPEQFREYREAVAAATDAATNELDVRMMEAVRNETRRQRAKRLREIKVEVKREIQRNPAVIARHWLGRGKAPDGGPLDEQLLPTKIDRESLVALYGEGSAITKRLVQLRVTSVDDGIDVQAVAEIAGFNTGDQLAQAIVAHADEKELINALAQTRLSAEQPDLAADPERRQQAAAQAVERQRSRVIREEHIRLRELVKRERSDRAARDATADIESQRRSATVTDLPRKADLRAQARRMLAERSMRSIRPAEYLRATQREARAAARATREGRHQDAAQALRRELLNHELFAEARAMHVQADKAVSRMERLSTNEALQRVGKANVEHRKALEHVLGALRLRPETGRSIDRAKALRTWAESRGEEGFEIDVPTEVLERAQRQHYSELTLGELTEISDFVKIIEHQARLKNRLIAAQDEREFGEMRAQAIETIRASRPARPEVNQIGGRASIPRWRRELENVLGGLRKLSSFAREMDQNRDGGVMWELTSQRLNVPAARETEMIAEATKVKADLVKSFETSELVAMDTQMALPGLARTISHAGRLSVALNWGNASNRQRVLNTFSQAEVDLILASLNKRDLEFVNAVWGHVDSFWPEISSQYERIYGLPPDKVEFEGFSQVSSEGEAVRMRGGYYPIRYDDERADSMSEAERIREMARGKISSSQTRNGHTKAREQHVGRELRYDLSVYDEHVRDVIHDITHREAVMDVNRVLRDVPISSAIREHYGQDTLQAMRDVVQDVVTGGRQGARGWGESLARHMRHGVTVNVLGFRMTTAMMQFTGLLPAMARVAPSMLKRGFTRMYGYGSANRLESAVEFVLEKSAVMRTRDSALSLAIREMRQDARISRSQFEVLRDAAAKGVTFGKYTTADITSASWWFIQKAQQGVDRVVWMGAYEQALDSGADDARAVAIADQTVIDTQTSSELKDLARVQSSNEYFKLFTLFYSYVNGMWNLSAESIADFKAGRRSMGQLITDMMVIHFVPTLATSLMYAGLEALDGDAPDDGEELAKDIAGDQITYLLGSVPLAREVVSAASGFYEGPAGTRGISELGAMVRQIQQAELDIQLLRATNQAAGTWLHYPASALDRLVSGFKSIIDGDTKSPTALFTGGPR